MIISNLFRVKPRLSTTIPSTCLLSTKTRWYDRGNIDFLLNENPYLVSRASSHDKDTTRAILDSAEKFVQRWHSVDKIFDTVEPQFEPIGSGNVIMAPEAKDICDAYNEAGFNQLGRGGSCETSYTVQCAVACISNSAFSSGVLGLWTLTSCAANLLKTHGSPSLVDKFHSQMINGKWSGTMALSETQAGSSLQYITTKAERTAIPGTYSITGSKVIVLEDPRLLPLSTYGLLSFIDVSLSSLDVDECRRSHYVREHCTHVVSEDGQRYNSIFGS